MTNVAQFEIRPFETVTAFALGPLETWSFKGSPAPLVDKVDYKFINGFVDVGDLPCRVATWAEIKARSVPELEPFATEALNLPGFNRRLDFSGFWHLPTRVKRWARTKLIVPVDGEYAFDLSTCGGVNIWVDGQHVVGFEPFTRNAVQTQDITLPLRAQGSEIVLLLEDMAERDTVFFAELTWKSDALLKAELETSGDPAELETLMTLARSVHPSKVVFSRGDALELSFESAAPRPVTVTASIGQSVHLSHKPPLFHTKVVLQGGSSHLTLGSLDTLEDAYHPLKLTFAIGDMRVERAIGFAILTDQAPTELPKSLAERKAHALRHLAESGEVRTGRLLAQLEAGAALDEISEEILADTLQGINDRRDCSDFVMVPLLWIYAEHRDKLTPEMARDIKSAVLGYRYWMDEPGNDAMWFWSENHVLCFHVSEYIAGSLFADEVFTNSGMTGAEHLALAQRRMDRWLGSVEDHGLAEWNSAAYYPVDFIGLLGFYHFVQGTLKARTKGILDSLFTMIALHVSGGVSSGTMGRAYDKELRAGPLSELAPFAAVAFGSGWLGSGVASLPMFCACDYEPPAALADYASPARERVVEARYVQGYGTAARLALYKTSDVQLSAAIDAQAGSTGHQQHLVDVQMAAKPFARVWVNHPGEDDPWGSNRPSFWAGNGIMPRIGMFENTCLVLNELGDAPRLPYSHAYAPLSQFDEVIRGDDWMALRCADGFVLLKASGAIESVVNGPGADLEHICRGARTGWALIAGTIPAGGLAVVAAHARALNLTLSNLEQALTLSGAGRAPLTLNYATGLSKAGHSISFPTTETVPQVTVSPLKAAFSVEEI